MNMYNLEPKWQQTCVCYHMTLVYIYLNTPPSTGAASCHQLTEEFMYTLSLGERFVGSWLNGQAPKFIMYTLLGLMKLLSRDPG